LPFYNDPSWGGTVVLDVWDLYQHYGNKAVLSDNYSMLAKWMDLMDTTVAATGDIYSGFSFGDWAAPGAEKNGSSLFAPESPNLSTTADLFQEATTLSRIAESLGRSADAAHFLSFADRLRAAFNTRFFHPETNTYGTTGNPLTGNAANDPGYRQTSNVLPLAYGLVPAGHERAVVRNLVADITTRGNDLNTGASGTKHLLPVLTQYGYGRLAYKLANQTDYPSWGNWVKNGATSSWETWAITTPDQSMNHAFLGTVDDWFYQDLAGIQATRPGYARLLISPMFPTGLHHLAASVRSPRGKIAVRWTRQNGHLRVTIQVPRGVPTTVRLPLSATVSKEHGPSNTDTGRGGHYDNRTAHMRGGTHTFVVS
jgi:alpha-L-rhamnosidase